MSKSIYTDQLPEEALYMERWQDPLTGETAIINKWRGETAVLLLSGLTMAGEIADLRNHMVGLGFARCSSL